mmetsp:Transcript_70178/g.192614  ORF Transcript_70178/g.192614 Transcript_70178/m.192614 type:complete len:240 (-) Transcript_70178:568-1287(-)
MLESTVHFVTKSSRDATMLPDSIPEEARPTFPCWVPICATSAPDDRRAQFTEIASELASEPQWAAVKRGRNGAVECVHPPLECAAGASRPRAECATATHSQTDLQLCVAVRARACDQPASVSWNGLADGQQVAESTLAPRCIVQIHRKHWLRWHWLRWTHLHIPRAARALLSSGARSRLRRSFRYERLRRIGRELGWKASCSQSSYDILASLTKLLERQICLMCAPPCHELRQNVRADS